MAATLKITIEGSWRGSILDTVRPIASLDLMQDKSITGLKSLVKEYCLKLLSNGTILVWCALTPQNQVKFSLRQGEVELVSLTTEGPFDTQVLMPDGKLYQFALKNDS